MEENNPEKALPLLAHLRELRACLLKALLGLALGAVLGCYFSEELFEILTYPIRQTYAVFSLIGTTPAEAFMIKLKTGLAAGLLLSLPYTFYQLWCFISPALKENEKRLAVPFIVGCSVCFFCGVLFCFFVVLPFAFSFFLEEYKSIGVAANLKISDYIGFALDTLMIFGLVFELPVITLILARLGLVTHSFLIRYSQISIVIIFIVAAILTPPDVMSQILLAVPLLILYAICILVAYLFGIRPTVERKISSNDPSR